MRPATPILGTLLLVGFACSAGKHAYGGDKVASKSDHPARDARLSPLPRTAPSPSDNPSTPEKIELGKRLFFDPRLSGKNTISCASCHMPERAFADGTTWNKGEAGIALARNTPTILNTGFYESYFWDGRANSLEEQALGPIRSEVEMNQDLDELEGELEAVPSYVDRFQAAFGSTPNRRDVARALAAFQRSLVTGPSPYDRYLAGDQTALSEQAKRGLELFQGRARCIECHNGPTLSDGKYYRLGISEDDVGRAQVTGKKEDRYRFRTPSLRNVELTGPYMHDGSLKTLDDVLSFYYRGSPYTSIEGLTPESPDLLGLRFSDLLDLEAFLKSLTGELPEVMAPDLPPLARPRTVAR
jgi:cytochrome c peroxidase